MTHRVSQAFNSLSRGARGIDISASVGILSTEKVRSSARRGHHEKLVYMT
jgi:hypothetical protein